MILKGKKIFLTGGAGFIGSALIKRVLRDNEVVVYDTLERNALKDMGLSGHPHLTVIQGDVFDLEKLKSAIVGSNIILHLAAVVGVDTVIKNPVKTITVNLLGTYNVLTASTALDKLERFVYFSTSEVFGTRAYNVDETHETSQGPVGEVRWNYAVSKLAGEYLSHSYYKEFKIPLVIIRPFNIYGPGQIMRNAIHEFILKALKNESLVINGDGSQIRAWCYIDDFIDGLILCLEKKQAIGEAFNIGNPQNAVTIYDLAKRILSLSDSGAKISFRELTHADIEIRIPNIVKAKTVLGFEPLIDLDEGIKRTINWYREKQTK